MSGGVDSSVAAALLVRAGYDVTGFFAVNYDDPKSKNSCWRADYEDALRVAAKLGFPLLRWDFQKAYREQVLDYMFSEYKKGNTPNPDVWCNKFIKFGVWLEKAKEAGFEKIATGHYARLKEKNGVFHLLGAKDENKDQTYFLHQLNQTQLARVLFPVGDYEKTEVRKLAVDFNLPTADKEESMGICFVGEVPMKEFLQKTIKTKQGKIVTTKGEIIGEHEGLSFYTIGQRHFGGKGSNTALFVVGKNLKTNELVVGKKDDSALYRDKIAVKKVHWIAGQEPVFPLICQVRLRHGQELQDCGVDKDSRYLTVNFSKLQRAPAPGQFAVFYRHGECLGGGEII